MSFKDLHILKHYTTYKNEIVKEFYTPILSETVLYQRSVGFFSSTSMIALTKGLSTLAKNGGRIQFIVSPNLSQEDIQAIEKGYEKRKIIEEALLREFKEPENYFQEERLNLLAHLIETGIMEIKVAFTPPKKSFGMYHEKVGIVHDSEGNRIVFTGSMNETINAFYNDYDSIVVFKSWEESREYADEMQADFDRLWNGDADDLEILEFPKVVKERITIRKKSTVNYEIDEEEQKETESVQGNLRGIPKLPDGFTLREYQTEAIDKWEEKGFRGIFDMATGTGKTYTGLGAIVRLFERKKRLAIIIVCPYQHLVEQWVEDIVKFNIEPIVGYSASKEKKWKQHLEDDVYDFNLGLIDTFCFVTTNATYSSKYVTDLMQGLGKDTLLLVDEAHNFGAPSLMSRLYPSIQYRLALSATLERHGDAEGTATLKNYFGDKCIEYDLKRAIDEKKLTPYYYYPVIVYLDDDELSEYNDLSYQIRRECHEDKFGKLKISEKGKRILLVRSRLIAGAKNKVQVLRKLMEEYKNDSHILVYCGATRTQSFENDMSERDEEGERQIVAVSKMLGLELGMKVTHFTSNESAEERELIKRRFSTADPYQAIVAIKCLDEGVNIPSIKTAFILASTTNPKEYIQRRGRVLRLAPGKPYAVIYDFITLAKPLDEINEYSTDFGYERGLAKRELKRMMEFGEIAINASDSDSLMEELMDKYMITDEDLKEGFEDEPGI